jgi:hypothetical protein
MSNPTPEEVRASILAKSDQINADDLVAGPVTVTIEKVRRGDKEQPIFVDLVGYQGRSYKPCKTCRRILIASFGDDPKGWIGQRMTLFCDPTVMWAGVKVGGVRISHLSGLNEPRVFVLNQARGKKNEVTILPLKTSEHQTYIDDVIGEIARADTLDGLKELGLLLKEKPREIRDAVRAAYEAKKSELEGGTSNGSCGK